VADLAEAIVAMPERAVAVVDETREWLRFHIDDNPQFLLSAETISHILVDRGMRRHPKRLKRHGRKISVLANFELEGGMNWEALEPLHLDLFQKPAAGTYTVTNRTAGGIEALIEAHVAKVRGSRPPAAAE
jgi:hypothetical protein